MKVTCEIIKDLLPLFIDNLCSNDSKAAIEEHIKICDNCKTELQNMQMSLTANNREQNINEATVLKILSKEWKKNKWQSLLRGIVYTLIVVAILALFLLLFADFRTFTY